MNIFQFKNATHFFNNLLYASPYQSVSVNKSTPPQSRWTNISDPPNQANLVAMLQQLSTPDLLSYFTPTHQPSHKYEPVERSEQTNSADLGESRLDDLQG